MENQPHTNYHANQRPTRPAFRPRAFPNDYQRPAYQPPPEETLAEEMATIERKNFTVSIRQNPRGAFLRVTEQAAPQPGKDWTSKKRETVIIPAEGIPAFLELVDRVRAKAATAKPVT